MSRAVKFLYLTQEQVIECGGLLGAGVININAHRVYHEARRRGIGQELELWHEPIWT